MFSVGAVAFTIFLICSRVSANAPISDETVLAASEADRSEAISHEPGAAEEERVQHLLLTILSAGLQESRYAVFEHFIKDYHKRCFDRVHKKIADSHRPNKLEQLKRLEDLYAQHIKDYPKQNRQAILDGQIPEPISRNAGIATNALCHQMYGFTL